MGGRGGGRMFRDENTISEYPVRSQGNLSLSEFVSYGSTVKRTSIPTDGRTDITNPWYIFYLHIFNKWRIRSRGWRASCVFQGHILSTSPVLVQGSRGQGIPIGPQSFPKKRERSFSVEWMVMMRDIFSDLFLTEKSFFFFFSGIFFESFWSFSFCPFLYH